MNGERILRVDIYTRFSTQLQKQKQHLKIPAQTVSFLRVSISIPILPTPLATPHTSFIFFLFLIARQSVGSPERKRMGEGGTPMGFYHVAVPSPFLCSFGIWDMHT